MVTLLNNNASGFTGSDDIMLKKENEQLELLNEFASEIGLSHNPREIMEKTLELLHDHLELEEAFFVIDYHDQYQRFARKSEKRFTTKAHRKALSEYVRQIIHKSQSIQTIDLANSSAVEGIPELPLPIVVIAPLLHQDNVYGGLVLLRNTQLSDYEMTFLKRLVRQTCGFLFHSLTFEEEREYLLIKQDIRTATDIQRQLLPKSAPELDGFQIYGETVPSHSVGGDYYDYLPMGKNRIGFCIGDATGKGVAAALLMANLQATIRSLVLTDKRVQEYQSLANNLLFNSTDIKKFASLFLAVLDTNNKTLSYSNAGHNPPLLISPHGETVQLREGGAPLGIISSLYFREESVYMNEGDILFLYSDGILEAVHAEDENIALQELEALIRENSSDSAEALTRRIIDYALNLQKEGPVKDDATVVIIKRC
jgi:sigma-B regulation protein RsbU (phosphoserine phosphatase)